MKRRHVVALGLYLAAAFVATASGAGAADAKRAIVPEDLFGMQFVSHATISHDGTRVAFIVTRMDLAKDAYLSNIWVAAADGSRVAQLTRGDHDASPDWSPDDRTLAFSRAAGGPSQIYTLDLAGGEARKLTGRPHGATAPVWSHDGRRIAFTATTLDAASPSHVDWRSLGGHAPQRYAKTDIRTLPWPRYETNGAGTTYDRHDHIWVMARDGSGAKQLTASADGEHFSVWSPDDARIAYDTDALSDPEGDAGTIYTVASSGGVPARIPVARYGASAPAFTQDGKRVVYAYIGRHDSGGTPGLASADLDGSHDTPAVAENSVAFGDAVISDTKENGAGCGVLEPDDQTYVGLISVPGGSEIDAFDLATGGRTQIAGGDRELEDCTTDRVGGRIAFTANDATHLSEIYVVDRAGGGERQLTHLNDALTEHLTLATPEAHTIANGQGGTVAYYVLKPPNAVAGKRYPTILDIHGGPETEFGNSFFDELQVLAARGYTVVYANPRGSVGYGYAWEEGLAGNWGDAMMADETAVMDEVAQRPDVDTRHTFVSGGSYGGYATLWIIAHTNRFAAALAERPAANLFTEALAADFAAPLAFQGQAGTPHAWGAPVQNYETLWRQSPLAHVASVHTPLLLLHSDEDTRTPIAETLQEYEALKILGRTVTLVQVPSENHDLSRTGKPIHRIERLHLMEAWFARFSR